MTPPPVSSVDLLASTDLPRHEVERLLGVATGSGRTEVLLGVELTSDQVSFFEELVRRRRAGEPLQYLEGTVQFGPLELVVDRRVLIPRPETEQLWELTVRMLAAPPQIAVDLCTGSGNLALLLKHTFPAATVYASDRDPRAVEVAIDNGGRTGLTVEFLVGDLFAPLPGSVRGGVDVIVANPPYVADDAFSDLPAEIREYEPPGALRGGADGLDVLRDIASGADAWLRPGGLVVCEIGEDQAEPSRRLFARYGAEVFPDLSGRPRFVGGRAPG